MPQATEELRKEWNGPSDETALTYLHGRGYVLTRDWRWYAAPGLEISDRDRRAVEFLIQEWDFGGFVE